MRTTVDLPDELSRRLKSEAALRGVKMKDLLTDFIRKGLKQEQASTEKPSPKKAPPTISKKHTVPVKAYTNTELQEILDTEDYGI